MAVVVMAQQGKNGQMRLVVVGTDLPGRSFCEPDGSRLADVHVAVQVRTEPVGWVPGDATEGRWHLDITTVIDGDGNVDFHGRAVHGKRGERFIYLTWGNACTGGTFHMFRRAKLMLGRIDETVMAAALHADVPLIATVRLTDERGGPRCARVDPQWSVA